MKLGIILFPINLPNKTEQITEDVAEMCTSKGLVCIEGNSQVTTWNEGCKTETYVLLIAQTISKAVWGLSESTDC